MSRLNLGLDSRKVFGEYLPSVFIQSAVISNPIDPVTGIPNITGTTNINVICDITFDKPADISLDMTDWVTDQYSDLYLYALLSPFEDLNTNLEDSNLDMKELLNATSPLDPTGFESSWPGFNYVINYMKEFFINNWIEDSAYCEGTNPDGTDWTDSDRRAGLGDPESDIARSFYGPSGDESQPIETEGPWTAATPGFIQENIEAFLNFISPTTADADVDDWGFKRFIIPLSSLAHGGGPVPGPSSVVTEGHYDSEGNEIIKISEIRIPFEYNTEENPIGITPKLGNTKKLFLICAVGRPVDASVPGALFNYNFGDISYEHILENNAVPDQTETIFLEIKSREVFNGRPIQTFDRKYFVPHPINQDTIVKSLENLMKNFNKWTTKDKRLERNVVSLKALLASKLKAIDLLVALKEYSIAYPHKDYGSPPGKFFKAFQQIINSFNETTSKQRQLSKNLAYNVTVIDNRPPPLKNIYLPPGTRALTRAASEDFIPSPWQLMSRYVEQTLPVKGLLTDFVEFALGEGFGVPWDVVGAGGMTEVSDEDMSDTMEAAWEYYDSSSGYSNLNEAQIYADTVVANKGVWFFDYEKALHSESLISKIFNVRKIQDLFHYTIPYEYYFCSDASTHRAEADLTLQNTPPGPSAPYTGHVPETVHNITLSTSLWDSGDEPPLSPHSKYFKWNGGDLKYGQPYVYTFGAINAEVDSFNGGINADVWTRGADGYGDESVSDSKWEMFGLGDKSSSGWDVMKDYVEWVEEGDGDSTFEHNTPYQTLSYLRYICFDLLNPAYDERLEGFGNYDLSSFGTENPYGPRDGYRMLAFQYRDYMDDDVAYYNTWGSFYGGRNGEYIAAMLDVGIDDHLRDTGYVPDMTADTLSDADGGAVLNDVWTSYNNTVIIRDRTIEVYDDIYKMAEDAFVELEAYALVAQELCSYNNITGAFNEFFTEGALKHYGDATKPWITAAYMYNALRELIYASFSSSADAPTDMPRLLEDCRRLSNDIGPVNGTVANIDSFIIKFRLVLHNFYPQGGFSSDSTLASRAWAQAAVPPPVSADDYDNAPSQMIAYLKTLWELSGEQIFSNKTKITKMIYGNLSLAAYWSDGFVDYNPPLCEDLLEHPDATDTDRVTAWLSCISEYYKTGLKDWCKFDVGSDDRPSAFSTTQPAWKVRRWTIIVAAFLYEFEDMITEYNVEGRVSFWTPGSYGSTDFGETGAFFNRANFEDFFGGEPFNLGALTPYSDSGRSSWLDIFSTGMFFLRRFNDAPDWGTLEDSWVPTSAWNNRTTANIGAGIYEGIIHDSAAKTWEHQYVEADTSFIRTYGDREVSLAYEIHPDTDERTFIDTYWTEYDGGAFYGATADSWEDSGRLTVFYWREFEYNKGVYGADASTALWTVADGGLDVDDATFYDGTGTGTSLEIDFTNAHAWRETGTITGDDGVNRYRWQDQFQFDLGLVQSMPGAGDHVGRLMLKLGEIPMNPMITWETADSPWF